LARWNRPQKAFLLGAERRTRRPTSEKKRSTKSKSEKEGGPLLHITSGLCVHNRVRKNVR